MIRYDILNYLVLGRRKSLQYKNWTLRPPMDTPDPPTAWNVWSQLQRPPAAPVSPNGQAIAAKNWAWVPGSCPGGSSRKAIASHVAKIQNLWRQTRERPILGLLELLCVDRT